MEDVAADVYREGRAQSDPVGRLGGIGPVESDGVADAHRTEIGDWGREHERGWLGDAGTGAPGDQDGVRSEDQAKPWGKRPGGVGTEGSGRVSHRAERSTGGECSEEATDRAQPTYANETHHKEHTYGAWRDHGDCSPSLLYDTRDNDHGGFSSFFWPAGGAGCDECRRRSGAGTGSKWSDSGR